MEATMTERYTLPENAGARRAGKAVWTGRILTGFAGLFMVFDAGVKLLQLKVAIEGSATSGYPATTVFGIGVIAMICTIVYVIPRTAPLGAILWTGYLGGAVASNVRVENPLFNSVFPIIFAAILWTGLWLRDARVRALLGAQ